VPVSFGYDDAGKNQNSPKRNLGKNHRATDCGHVRRRGGRDYDLGELLTNLTNIMRPCAVAKGLEFNVEVDSVISVGLYGDNVRIQQILMNIVSNAIKYTKQGSVTLKVQQCGFEADKIFLRFMVEDTGIGIRAEDQARLFQDFERFDSEKNRGIEGTGLGLAITHRLVKLLNGEISVESVYGKGTVFSTIEKRVYNFANCSNNFALLENFNALRYNTTKKQGEKSLCSFYVNYTRL